ncbi:hypothetical protein [Dyella japonica]|jgi:hypothetical protein|uniref:Uncharacterized protein n=1 Tax=Dyella japonica DSM 16301 TaxID=1440762 RepID=A0A0G9HDV4_9GAMM|nr:hypothetical protein [Dyella japonica]KLD65872.1 hypothetical protein Y882_01490 [Dyella japonica DSM 16301]
MAEVAGMTSNGFNYTAEYLGAVHDSVYWSATFRLNGIYRGMRHGRVFEVSELSSTELQVAIQDDIEDTWVNEH